MYFVFLADGFEEVEALSVVDVLRRLDIDVKMVGIGKKRIKGSHSIEVNTDLSVKKALKMDVEGVILPGGLPGATNIGESREAREIIMKVAKEGGLIASICAAPSVIGEMGLLEGISATCYPGFEDKLLGANVVDAKVMRDKNFITGKGPGASLLFAYEVAEYILGQSVAELKKAMIYE